MTFAFLEYHHRWNSSDLYKIEDQHYDYIHIDIWVGMASDYQRYITIDSSWSAEAVHVLKLEIHQNNSKINTYT